jgi:hypothetical protein
MNQQAFISDLWSKKISDDFMDSMIMDSMALGGLAAGAKIQPQQPPPTQQYKAAVARAKHMVLDATRQFLKSQLPLEVRGPVGDDIIACLVSVTERRDTDPARNADVWKTRLVFKLGSEHLTFEKSCSMQRGMAVPDEMIEEKVLHSLVLTKQEVAMLAVGV